MELMKLEMFIAVVEEGSVRRASERVFRTQPAVSIAIRRLEEEIDSPLFDRSKRCEYRLTQVGETLYTYAKRMLSLRSETMSAIEDVCNLRLGGLRIGANEVFSLYLLPQLAHAYSKQNPGIRMEIKCEGSESLLADLKDRKLDLALLPFKPVDRELEAKFIARDELVLIANPRHRFASKGHIDIENVSGEPFLAMEMSQSSSWHKEITDAFMGLKTPLNVIVENAPVEAIKKMIAIGLGIGFVPLMCVREEQTRGELTVIKIDEFHHEHSVWLVRRRAVQSHAVKAFVQLAVTFDGQAPDRELGFVRSQLMLSPTHITKAQKTCSASPSLKKHMVSRL
jgi:DNA-binding transcriptional LysR family regulator